MTEPRKIVIFTSEFPPGPGGIGNHAWNLAFWLEVKGERVDVIAPRREGYSREEPGFDAKQPFSVRRYTKGKNNLPGYLALVWMVYRCLRSLNRNDVFLVSGMMPLILGGALAKIFRGKIIFGAVAHGLDINPTHPLLRRIVKWSLRQYRFVIPVSTFTASKLPAFDNTRVTVINNGENIADYTSENGLAHPGPRLIEGEPALITVGTLSFRKGQINVVRALPFLRKVYPRVHYHMVGLPQEASPIRAEAIRLGVDDCITIHGAVDEERKKELLKNADVFLMLSNHSPNGDFEGFGIAILEANLLGVPAIGSANSGIADAIADGESGLLVNPTSPESIVKAVQEIMKRRANYSARAQAHAKNFAWEFVVDKYIEVFKEVSCVDL